MAWGVSDFGQGFGLGSGFDGMDLGTIDTATPPLADNSNGSPQMQPFDWSSVSWIGGALDKALNFSLQKDQLDYARQNSQYQRSLQHGSSTTASTVRWAMHSRCRAVRSSFLLLSDSA